MNDKCPECHGKGVFIEDENGDWLVRCLICKGTGLKGTGLK